MKYHETILNRRIYNYYNMCLSNFILQIIRKIINCYHAFNKAVSGGV